MSASDAWTQNPRQYRPHIYGPNLPQSTSMTSIEYGRNLSHPTTLSSHRIPTSTSYNRRRTNSSFPQPAPLHGASTIASSRLTASASTNDISQPSPWLQRHRLAEIQNVLPSRIPSPVFSKSPTPLRHVSTPVLPSQKKQKENIEPKALRLLGPISPTRSHVPHIPKSRTMGMLSSITSSFSRSNLHISGSRQTSTSSTRSTDLLTSVSSWSSLPLPVSTTNVRQIQNAQPNSYWSGRFQALNDKFHNESLELSLHDSKILQQYIEDAPPPWEPKLVPPLARSKVKAKKDHCSAKNTEIGVIDTCNNFMTQEENKRLKQVFVHLEALCVTIEAKRSLWEWQLAYARQEQNEKLLPTGGRMSDVRDGWVTRVGRAIIGSSDSTMSKRTDLKHTRRKGSLIKDTEYAQKGRHDK